MLDTEIASRANCTGRVICPSGLDAPPGTTPQKESEGVRSSIPRPNSFRALAKRRFRALLPSTSIKNEGETPYVRDVCPLVSPVEGDGDLRPGVITGVGDGVICIDGEHLVGSELPVSSTLSSGEAPKDSGTTLS